MFYLRTCAPSLPFSGTSNILGGYLKYRSCGNIAVFHYVAYVDVLWMVWMHAKLLLFIGVISVGKYNLHCIYSNGTGIAWPQPQLLQSGIDVQYAINEYSILQQAIITLYLCINADKKCPASEIRPPNIPGCVKNLCVFVLFCLFLLSFDSQAIFSLRQETPNSIAYHFPYNC